MDTEKEFIYTDNDAEIERLTEDYRCSRCWGRLNAIPAPEVPGHRTMKVGCLNPNCDGVFFVTEKWVQSQRNDDRRKYMIAKRNIGHLLGMVETKISAEELMINLGF